MCSTCSDYDVCTGCVITDGGGNSTYRVESLPNCICDDGYFDNGALICE